MGPYAATTGVPCLCVACSSYSPDTRIYRFCVACSSYGPDTRIYRSLPVDSIHRDLGDCLQSGGDGRAPMRVRGAAAPPRDCPRRRSSDLEGLARRERG